MSKLLKLFLSALLIAFVGFTIVQSDNDVKREVEYNQDPITADEETNLVNTTMVDFIAKGEMKASWYGPKFHGKSTANGEIYDQMAFTAAHKSLKFGTLLRLTNLKNGKSVVVRINDRGPYIHGRDLDLSKAAAESLEMMNPGVIKIKVEEIKIKGLNNPVVAVN